MTEDDQDLNKLDIEDLQRGTTQLQARQVFVQVALLSRVAATAAS